MAEAILTQQIKNKKPSKRMVNVELEKLADLLLSEFLNRKLKGGDK